MLDRRLLSKRWRINHLYKVRDKAARIVTFKENAIQKQINDVVFSCHPVDILKSRQVGVTTNFAIIGLDDAVFRKNWTSAILAHKDKDLPIIFEKVRFAYEHMDPRLRPVVDKGGGSRYELRFPEIGSKIFITIENRGGTINRLHISESAFADPARIKATLETVPKDFRHNITNETTPNGLNHFYDRWMDNSVLAEKLFFPWFVHSEYQLKSDTLKKTKEEKAFCKKAKKLFGVNISDSQLAFRRWKISELKDLYSQEYPEDEVTCFLASGNPYFNQTAVKKRLSVVPEPVIDTGTLSIYEEPVRNKLYVIGADTAEGIGGDNSCAQVIRLDTLAQVACLTGNFKPSEFASLLSDLGYRYRTSDGYCPMIGIERNNHGHAVILEMNDHLYYPNLYFGRDDRPGWVTNSVTKPIMLNAMRDHIDSNSNLMNDRQTLHECLTFMNDNGKLAATEGKKDDRVIAFAIALQMAISALSSLDLSRIEKTFFSEGGDVERI